MPHKVDFQVVHVSCEDDKYPSSELNSKKHGPLIQGWISQRFCLYPIDLIIQFEKKIILKKVQILSHQYLIASKIEFYIGDCPDENVSYETAKYTRLGYIELSTNERTDFRARELKSVHVDAEGTFLKLVIHKNYVNKANLYNQVGLVALNVIGMNLDEEQKPPEGGENSVVSSIHRPDYISPLDDLAFSMYQDPEISQIIRNLDKKKNDCVIGEKFDEAKRLKQAITELQKIGERLARYDIEKRQAIDEEDYERAKVKKQQMQQYRAETYKQLQENNLLDVIDPEFIDSFLRKLDNNNYSSYDSSSIYEKRVPKSKELPLDTRELDSDRNQRSKSSLSMLSPKNTVNPYKSSMTTPLPNEPERAVTPYDDRLIPRLRHNRSRFEKSEAPGTSADNYENGANEAVVPGPNAPPNGTEGGGTDEYDIFDPLMDGTEEMTEREVREAALMNDYLGKQLVTKLYSKNFQNREEAIQEVFNNLSNYKGEKEDAKALMRAAAILVAKMSKDNVFSVFNNALKLFHFLLNDFAKQHSIGKQDINYALEKCLPVLIHRTGDSNARLRQRAHEYIVEMANYPEIKPLHTVPHYCTIPIKLHIAPRLALSRVEIIEDLMKSLGTKDNGLTADSVAKFCAQALEHTSGEVRELATKILISMYKENGSVVRRSLPPDNEMNRRNKKYRVLYDAFDGIDGKPIQSYDRQNLHSELTSTTPRFNRNNLRTPTKSKTPNRGTSMDRKTPMSMADESEYNPDNTCMFCGEVNEKFVKQGFEMHYWKSCPMLKQCSECKQVIEVAVQNEHLLTECQYKSQYKKCPRCTEAINVSNTQDNDFHFKDKKCQPVEKRGNKCPLCHMNIGSGEEVWKDHLMSTNGCPKNPRKSITGSLTDAASNPPKKSVSRK